MILWLPGYAYLLHCSAASGSYTGGIYVVFNFRFHFFTSCTFMGYLTFLKGDSILVECLHFSETHLNTTLGEQLPKEWFK